jgi:hypothetical protein
MGHGNPVAMQLTGATDEPVGAALGARALQSPKGEDVAVDAGDPKRGR